MRPMTYRGIEMVVQWLVQDTQLTSLNNFNTHVIRQFLYSRREQRMWSTKSVINYRQYLKTFFEFCVKVGHLKINPVETIDKPKLPQRLPRCLNDQET